MVEVVVKQSSRRSTGWRTLGLLVTVCVQLWTQGSLTSYAVALREAAERHSALQERIGRIGTIALPARTSSPRLCPPLFCAASSAPSLGAPVPVSCCCEKGDVHVNAHMRMCACACAWAGQALLRDAESGMRRLKNDTKSCETLGRGISVAPPPSGHTALRPY